MSVITYAFIVSALLTLSPILRKDVPRAERYAADIYTAAQGDIDLALALVVTAEGESRFRSGVETCREVGDRGKAVSMYQLHRDSGSWGGSSRTELCNDNALATKRAAEWLIMLRLNTGGWRGAIRAYIGCDMGDPRAQRRIRNFRRLKGGVT